MALRLQAKLRCGLLLIGDKAEPTAQGQIRP
jgi:hypothetical protein